MSKLHGRTYMYNVEISTLEGAHGKESIFNFGIKQYSLLMGTFLRISGTLVHIPVGQHVSLRVPQADGSFLTRSYTPVIPSLETTKYQSLDGKKIHLIVKIYDKGQMTQKLDSMQIGNSPYSFSSRSSPIDSLFVQRIELLEYIFIRHL